MDYEKMDSKKRQYEVAIEKINHHIKEAEANNDEKLATAFKSCLDDIKNDLKNEEGEKRQKTSHRVEEPKNEQPKNEQPKTNEEFTFTADEVKKYKYLSKFLDEENDNALFKRKLENSDHECPYAFGYSQMQSLIARNCLVHLKKYSEKEVNEICDRIGICQEEFEEAIKYYKQIKYLLRICNLTRIYSEEEPGICAALIITYAMKYITNNCTVVAYKLTN